MAYRNILLPTNLSQSSLEIMPHVAALSEKFNAMVHLAYVAKTNEYYREDDCEWKKKECVPGQIITQKVIEFADQYCGSIQSLKAVVLDGDAENELLGYIEKTHIDLVMMVTKGKSPLGKAIFGSIAGGIMRRSPVPVFLIRPENY